MNRYCLAFMLLGLHCSLAQAGELGRLFLTPQQRQQLEFQETGNGSSEVGGRRNSIVVNGVVQKKGGNRTIWVNGTAQPAGHADDKSPATASVNVPGKSQPVHLKVGQRLLLDTPAPEENPASETDK